MSQHAHTDKHRDDIGSRFEMWLFIFTELLLFAGLFITYSVFRYKNWQAFHLAAEELDVFIGAYNQDKMDAILDVDGKEELVIYAAPVGKIK